MGAAISASTWLSAKSLTVPHPSANVVRSLAQAVHTRKGRACRWICATAPRRAAPSAAKSRLAATASRWTTGTSCCAQVRGRPRLNQCFKLKVQGSQRLGGGCSLRRAVPHSGSEAVRRSVIEACKSVPEKGCGALARTFAPVAPTPWMSVTLTPFPLSRTPSPPPSVPPCAFRPRTRSRVHIQIGRHPTGGLLNHSAGHGIGVRGSGVSHVGVRGLGRGKDPLRLRAFVAELRP